MALGVIPWTPTANNMAPGVIPWTPTATTWLLESLRGHQQPTTWLQESFNSELSQAGTYHTAKHSHPKTLAYSKSVLTN